MAYKQQTFNFLSVLEAGNAKTKALANLVSANVFSHPVTDLLILRTVCFFNFNELQLLSSLFMDIALEL